MTDFVAIQSEITNYFEQECILARKRALDAKKSKVKSLDERFRQCQLMVMAGLMTESEMKMCLKYGNYGRDMKCKPGDKIKLRDLFGELTVNEKPDDVENPEENTGKFYITFKSGKYVGPQWYVEQQLPEDSPCKITREASYYYTMSCPSSGS